MRGGLRLLARATLRSRPPPPAAVLAPVAKTEMSESEKSAADSRVNAAIQAILQAVRDDGWDWGGTEGQVLSTSQLARQVKKRKAVEEIGSSAQLIVYESVNHAACRLAARYSQQYEMTLDQAEKKQWQGLVTKVCRKQCGKKMSSKMDMAKKSSEFLMGVSVLHSCLGLLHPELKIQAGELAFIQRVMLPLYRAAANRYCSEVMVEGKREMVRRVVAPECDTEVRRVFGELTWLPSARLLLDGEENRCGSLSVSPEIDPGNDPVVEYHRLERLRDVLTMFIESNDEHLVRYFKRISVVALAEIEMNVEKQRAVAASASGMAFSVI